MTFEELGSLLRGERERHGVSEEDMADRLKIHVRVVRALETGDAASLPHAVYVRGFIRAYGTTFDLDAATMQEALEAAPRCNDAEETPQRPTPLGISGNPRLLLLGLGAAVLCLAGILLFLFYDDSASSVDSRAPVSTAQPSLPTTADAPARPWAQEKPAATSRAMAPRPTPVLPAFSAPATPPAPATSAQDTAEKPATTTQDATDRKPADHNTLIITALSECWIHSNADNIDTRQFSLRRGDTFALTFSKKLTIKFGNAGGVRLRYNGEELPPPGASGQVRTLTFPPTP